ncbi:MAG: hypothetical protein QUS33_13895 [Dehalococcoidia bacterium]|nr:hypothetical protein [Dehalococcoidia bacterium]
MGLFVWIARYTPEQSIGVENRWNTMANGTAPKAVLEAWGRIKVLEMLPSPQNGFAMMVVDVPEDAWVDAAVCARYMADVWSLESYPVINMEQYAEMTKRLPLEQIPRK